MSWKDDVWNVGNKKRKTLATTTDNLHGNHPYRKKVWWV